MKKTVNTFFFAILAAFAIATLSELPSALAADGPSQITRFRDYEIQKNPDGSIAHTVGLPEYVWDGFKWVDRVINNNGTHFNVYSETGSFSVTKSDCTITQYSKGFNPISQSATGDDIIIEKWFWTIMHKDGANPWSVVDASIFGCSVSTFSNSTGKYMTMTRTHIPSSSYLKITLAAPEGKPIEDYTEFYMNIPAWNGDQFAFALWAKDVSANSVKLRNGTTIQIPEGTTTIPKSQLTMESLEFVTNGNAFYMDWKKAKDDFKSVSLNMTGTQLDVLFAFNDLPAALNTGQKIVMDPTYGFRTASDSYYIQNALSASTACSTTYGSTATTPDAILPTSGNDACRAAIFSFNIASIPNDATPTEATLEYDVSTSTNPKHCRWRAVTTNTTGQAMLNDAMFTGTILNYSESKCMTTGTGKTISFDISNFTSYFSGQLASDYVNIGGFFANTLRGASKTTVNFVDSDARLQIVYYTASSPLDGVSDLTATLVGTSEADLEWTEPGGLGSCESYQINYTTPFGLPQTIIVNDTGSCASTEYSVTGLLGGGNYSFRVGIQRTSGYNGSGNIANLTMAFLPANFTIGSFNVNTVNTDTTSIRFVRTDDNTTQTTLTVIYDEDYDMSCTFDFQNEQVSHTYYPMTPEEYDATHNSTDFVFTDPQNDVIQATCMDTVTNDTGRYVMTQSSFPLLEQIQNFRNGTYGTAGIFGAFDLITLAVLFVSMIGFNRINETVGGIINVSIIGALAYFEIITLPTVIFGAIAVVIMIMVAQTRKD